ncbi:MAG: type II CRISPR-associated endonuclease Cas1 [Armatimonadetes bacterium]|nr:type II CRISPR-associated endonuclease Cas1 [Armatimonadota bacterium]
MIGRVIEVATPARLSLADRQIVVDRSEADTLSAPLEDVAVLILDNPTIALTLPLVTACAEQNIAIVGCDQRHMPASLTLPIEGNSTHTETLLLQIEATGPAKKQAWKQIVQAKINAQAALIEGVCGRADKLRRLAAQVASGDPTNCEGNAAQIYFQRLFGEDFRRERFGDYPNNLLNYGYAILRACVARAVVGAGLHPSLGIHHRNRYNPFCLADDLMEPFRPLVDAFVYRIWRASPDPILFDRKVKAELLRFTVSDVSLRGKSLPFLAALTLYTASVRRFLCQDGRKLQIPNAFT